MATSTYNVDKTGFQIAIGRNQWIISQNKTHQAYLASSSNCKMVTYVETIGSNGNLFPLMFIFSGTLHMKH